MGSLALQRTDVIVGVDTHKDQHVAVAIDGLGGLVGEPLFIDATNGRSILKARRRKGRARLSA